MSTLNSSVVPCCLPKTSERTWKLTTDTWHCQLRWRYKTMRHVHLQGIRFVEGTGPLHKKPFGFGVFSGFPLAFRPWIKLRRKRPKDLQTKMRPWKLLVITIRLRPFPCWAVIYSTAAKLWQRRMLCCVWRLFALSRPVFHLNFSDLLWICLIPRGSKRNSRLQKWSSRVRQYRICRTWCEVRWTCDTAATFRCTRLGKNPHNLEMTDR